jgi:histone H3/H4
VRYGIKENTVANVFTREFKQGLRKKRAPRKGLPWTVDQRYNAVATWLTAGNLPLTSNITGIPVETLRAWKYDQAWWDDVVKEIKESNRLQTNSKVQKITEKAVDVVIDRLENGDFVYNQKTGKLSRKPVGAHVANRILNDSIDKQVLFDKIKREEVKETREEEIKARLENLAKQFSAFATKNPPKTIEATDVEIIPQNA